MRTLVATYKRSFLFAAALHVAAFVLLFWRLNPSYQAVQRSVQPDVDIIKAVAVNPKSIENIPLGPPKKPPATDAKSELKRRQLEQAIPAKEAELTRDTAKLQKPPEQKQAETPKVPEPAAEKAAQKEAELKQAEAKKAADATAAEKAAAAEAQKLAAAKIEAEKAAQEAAELKQAEAKKAAEAKAAQEKAAAVKKAKEEAEAKKAAEAKAAEKEMAQEEAKLKQAEIEAEAKKIADAQAAADKAVKDEEAQKANQELEAAQDQALQDQISKEQQAIEAAKSKLTQSEVDKYLALIQNALENNWNKPPNLDPGAYCILHVQLGPGGTVISVNIARSSGNAALDNSARTAVFKASPLPVPGDPDLFDAFRQLTLKAGADSIGAG